jgi:Cu(I)/Ag(I) efflux system membrane fusion protein
MIVNFKTYIIILAALVVQSCSDGNTHSDAKGESQSASKMDMAGKKEDGSVTGRTAVEIPTSQRQLINIRTIPVTYEDASATIRTVGIVAYDQSKVVDVNLKIMGWAEKLYVDKPGQAVTKGEPLMDLYSPTLYSGEQEYLIAFNYYQQLKTSSSQREIGGVPYDGWKQNLEDAKSLMESSFKRLKLWDIGDDEIAAIEKFGKPTDTLQLKSPVTGYVVEKKIYPGEMIQQGMTLYRVADLSIVWINADFYEYELPLIKVGQKVVISLQSIPDQTFEGTVDFIYPYLENKTRTITVRLVVPNNEELLKPDMYANIQLEVNLGKQLIVPADAVFNTGLQQYVFVETDEGIFIPRAVKIGPRAGDYFIIREGLKKDERVVIDGNFLIDSESQLKGASKGGHEWMKNMQK